jgi:hypothetical protein
VARDTAQPDQDADPDSKPTPDAARTDHPTGERQAAANAEDEPAG